MDIDKTLAQLREERACLIAIIEQLESLDFQNGRPNPPASRRGRKSMGAAERREVSERMKKYWASRRKMQSSA